ncbi:16441_t:CDS:2 [Racocetra persica]|uniref:16441_t:CDS:1 n=1 Tax=Racocetra persica TaxID=160502 RepID=A0ACA9MXL5_9GLOM|nr:16441_t:CDS:2 [Racocetra persica]
MSDRKIGGKISSTSEGIDPKTRKKIFDINVQMISHDSHSFKRCIIRRRIEDFDGEVDFSYLPVVLREYDDNDNQMLKDEISRQGQMFMEISRKQNCFMNYNGSLLRWKEVDHCWQVEKTMANGRVIIDLKSFATMNPGYRMGNAKPPNKCGVELLTRKGDYIMLDQINEEEFYLLTPAVIYGFSFALKEWGQFEVLGLSKINFNENAFDQLELSKDKKDIIRGLVMQYSEYGQMRIKPLDPISNKGKGCIFLCYGPPGTGKTLTAESVAEFLKRPLWTLSVNELGTNPVDLENKLRSVLEVAIKWNAIILLDEADIYLEKRDIADLKRNTLVGIFLRLLEYYQGVLFLTTNRGMNLDDAIYSRINMTIHYPKLGFKERHKIWTNFLKNADLSFEADDFSKYELNGRDIRNILHTARTLAQSKEESLTPNHVINVIETIQKSRNEMQEMKKTITANETEGYEN